MAIQRQKCSSRHQWIERSNFSGRLALVMALVPTVLAQSSMGTIREDIFNSNELTILTSAEDITAANRSGS